MQDDEQAHQFVVYTDGSATMTEMWPCEAVGAGWELAILHRPAAGQMTWCGSQSAPIQLGSTGTDVLGAIRLTRSRRFGGIDVEGDAARMGQSQDCV